MTRIRAAVLIFVVVVGAIIALVPAIRDEISWWWAESHNHSVDFMAYQDAWPNGRHVAEAKMKYSQRRWVENEKLMIHQAYEENGKKGPDADAEYSREKRLRRDNFSWKAATNSNTLQSYQDYLRQFPGGRYARQARARIVALNQTSQDNPATAVPQQP